MPSRKGSKRGGAKKEKTVSPAPSMTSSGSSTTGSTATMVPAVAPTMVPGDASMPSVIVAPLTTAPVTVFTPSTTVPVTVLVPPTTAPVTVISTASEILSLLSQLDQDRDGDETLASVLTPTVSPISSAAPVANQEPSSTTAPVADLSVTESPLLSQVLKGREGTTIPASVLTTTVAPISSVAPVLEPTSTTAPVVETMLKSKAPTVSQSFSLRTSVPIVTPSPSDAPLVFYYPTYAPSPMTAPLVLYYPTYAPSPMTGISIATPAPSTFDRDTSGESRPTPLTLDKAAGAPPGSAPTLPGASPVGPVSIAAASPDASPEASPVVPKVASTGAPTTLAPTPQEQYMRKVLTTPISIEIQGSFDLDASKDEITSMLETALAPYLIRETGSILKGFTISTRFLQNGARRLQETITAVSVIEVSFELTGTELPELLKFDEVAASNMVSAFFSDDDAIKVLVEDMVASGIAISSIKLSEATTTTTTTASAGEESRHDVSVGKKDGPTSRTALIAGMLSGCVVFAALAAGMLVNRHKESNKFSLEQQLKEHCGTVISSHHSVSSLRDLTYNYNETSALQFSPSQNASPLESPRQKHKWSPPDSVELIMMDGPNTDATQQQRRNHFGAPSSDCDSIFTTNHEPDGLKHGQTPESQGRKRWLPIWNRKVPPNRTDEQGPSQQDHYDTIEIDGELRTVYLTPIDIL